MRSEGPYHFIGGIVEGPDGSYKITSDEKYIQAIKAQSYAEGVKAERERCAHIAEHEAGEIPECMTGRIIAEKIRGGQDGE